MKPFKHVSLNIASPDTEHPLMEQKPQTVSYNIQIPKDWDNAVKEVCKDENISKSLFIRSVMKYWFDKSDYDSLKL
jgi:uncharacterized membrane protein